MYLFNIYFCLLTYVVRNDLLLKERSYVDKVKTIYDLLKEEIQFEDAMKINEIIASQPYLLHMSKTDILDKINYLKKEFDINNEQLKEIIFDYPITLTLQYSSQAAAIYDYLNVYLNLSKEEFNTIIRSNPAIISVDVNIINIITYYNLNIIIIA